ncbi:MAG: nucleotidyltransferase domain-containing protein [Elusimicrobiota bacterium]|nr:nucleotidyltransferase domain-containing protein [Endomicrobiia bacterium]MDW8166579.1 nucleotidyltransferase domain-containing protein [Elusimicrobiota bacterium]
MKKHHDFGLSKELLQEIKSVFEKYTEIQKASIFGSRVTDKYRKNSDIDIVIYSPNLDLSTYLLILSELNQINTLLNIDLIHYERVKNTKLKEDIQKKSVEIYSKTE